MIQMRVMCTRRCQMLLYRADSAPEVHHFIFHGPLGPINRQKPLRVMLVYQRLLCRLHVIEGTRPLWFTPCGLPWYSSDSTGFQGLRPWVRIIDTCASCSYTLRAGLFKVAFDLSSYGVASQSQLGAQGACEGSIYGGIPGMIESAGDVFAEEALRQLQEQTIPSKVSSTKLD